MNLDDFENQVEVQKDRKSFKKHLVFLTGEKRYAFPLSKIKEVIRVINITPLPGVVSFYKGLVNIRGQIISVIDLRTLLGIQGGNFDPKRNAIIITQVADITVGVIVDRVVEVKAYSDDQINENVANSDFVGEGVYGVAKESDAELTLLLSMEKAVERTDFLIADQQAQSQYDVSQKRA